MFNSNSSGFMCVSGLKYDGLLNSDHVAACVCLCRGAWSVFLKISGDIESRFFFFFFSGGKKKNREKVHFVSASDRILED